MCNLPVKLVLASTSPRRREILSQLGIPFEVMIPTFEEISDKRRDAKEEALFFAEGKARAVAKGLKNHIVIGSDTLIVFEGRKIGKPQDAQDARAILKSLQGQAHQIFTAVFIIDTTNGSREAALETVDVRLHRISDTDIADYVATKEPLDKAGAYAVQGKGRRFIRSLKGDRLAAIGLPLGMISRFLSARGFRIPKALDENHTDRRF